MDECRVFLELINYIEKSMESGIAIFKLSELHSLYVHRLEDMGINKGVNETRLKDKLLQHFPESQEQQNGKYTIIVFKEGMRSMLSEALKVRDFSEDTAILAKAAMIIRKDIFNHDSFRFCGSFPSKCQENSIPSSLKSLISLVLNGLNLKNQDHHESQAALSIGQAIYFNTKKKTSKPDAHTRHTHCRARAPTSSLHWIEHSCSNKKQKPDPAALPYGNLYIL